MRGLAGFLTVRPRLPTLLVIYTAAEGPIPKHVASFIAPLFLDFDTMMQDEDSQSILHDPITGQTFCLDAKRRLSLNILQVSAIWRISKDASSSRSCNRYLEVASSAANNDSPNISSSSHLFSWFWHEGQ